MTQPLFAARASSKGPASGAMEKNGVSPDLLDTAMARIARLEMTLASSGGALHDVNNMLTVLAGNLYLMTEVLREHPVALSKSRSARNTAERASALIRELLSAAKDVDDSVHVICPARHVLAIEPLLRRSIGSRHRFRVKHSDHPWDVAASAAQFESAVANLVINSREALAEPGSIEVLVDNIDRNDALTKAAGLPAGKYVRVSVIDTGTGIAAELLPHVTEPLVTSKPSGASSGLGLSMVNRFVLRAGGKLNVNSEVGRGTRIDLWLPHCSQPAEDTANMTLPLSTLPGGDETVMVLTNDSEVSGIVQQLLDALGYTVISAESRTQALMRAKSSATIGAIICDRTVDGFSDEVSWLSALRHCQPEIRQLAILGAGEAGGIVAPDADAYLHPPLSVGELANALRSVLEPSSCR